MGLKVEAHPGFIAVHVVVPSLEWAKAVALAMLDDGRHFYMEPQPDDHWFIKVDAEHEAFLRRLCG